jgi:hypothetical protein
MQKPIIYKLCGAVGIIGCIAAIAGDIIGIAVHEKQIP